jgi:glycosyltransferase involved in cell wall biosynthesis
LGAAESLDFGTPVIIADSPALREATRGLMPVFRYDDEDGWKAIIRELALNSAALAALQRIAREEYPLGSHGDDLGAMLDSMKETGFHRKLRTQAAASPTGDSATRRASP